MTATTTLSSKGQIIIPKALRAARRWGPGTQLEVHDTPDGVLLRPLQPAPKTALGEGLAAIRRRVGHRGPAVSLAQMDAAVIEEAARRAAAPAGAKPAARKRER
ncbi:MAG: AbrB/MazE/SpoVT family DNA-binding domain-containing protein [Burkholderiaceae bacterium]|nr:AbrB/MazE/SpoVT family DNA-binding domain-containing protein [Burkholderiaceae bacterium]